MQTFTSDKLALRNKVSRSNISLIFATVSRQMVVLHVGQEHFNSDTVLDVHSLQHSGHYDACYLNIILNVDCFSGLVFLGYLLR